MIDQLITNAIVLIIAGYILCNIVLVGVFMILQINDDDTMDPKSIRKLFRKTCKKWDAMYLYCVLYPSIFAVSVILPIRKRRKKNKRK